MSRIWVLTGGKAGDDGQVRAVARALGGVSEEKRLRWNSFRLLPNWLAGASRTGLERRAAGGLVPPWPDLVVGIGRRSVPAALWIRSQSNGRSRIIHLGRPRAPLHRFDLVITTPQYKLPPEPNVVTAPLPLTAGHDNSPEDHRHWQERWDGLRRPLTAVLIGGSTYPYRLTPHTLVNILDQAKSAAGTLIVVTSPRTGAAAAAALTRLVAAPDELYLWSSGAPGPYRSLLATADRIVVTEDSASMIAEAVNTGRPVAVAFLPRWPLPSWRTGHGLTRILARLGILTPPRDVRRLAAAVVASGRATALDHAPAAPTSPPFDDWDVILARARAVLEAGGGLSS